MRTDQMTADTPTLQLSSGPALVAGLMALAVGALVLAFPGLTLFAVGLIFGVQLIVLGGIRTATALTSTASRPLTRVVAVVLGLITVATGILCLAQPSGSLVLLASFLGIGWIADGVAELSRSGHRARSNRERASALLLGALLVIAGLAVILFPGTALNALTRLAGISLLLIGVLQVVGVTLTRADRNSSTPREVPRMSRR